MAIWWQFYGYLMTFRWQVDGLIIDGRINGNYMKIWWQFDESWLLFDDLIIDGRINGKLDGSIIGKLDGTIDGNLDGTITLKLDGTVDVKHYGKTLYRTWWQN